MHIDMLCILDGRRLTHQFVNRYSKWYEVFDFTINKFYAKRNLLGGTFGHINSTECLKFLIVYVIVLYYISTGRSAIRINFVVFFFNLLSLALAHTYNNKYSFNTQKY